MKIKENQRDDHRGEASIHRDVVVGETRQILPEHDARHHRSDQGEDDARQNLQERPAACGQPGMQHEQCDDQRQNGDAVAGDIEELLVAFDDDRNVAPCRLEHQRTEHDQESHRERGERRNQRVADRLQPQPIPAARLDHRIGPVEGDAKRLHAIGGKVDRKHRANGQDIAAGRGEDIVNVGRERVGDLPRPDLKQKSGGLVCKFLGAEEAGKRRQHDQKRKQRHQGRQRDVAGDCPAVIGQKRVERVEGDVKDVANEPHRRH